MLIRRNHSKPRDPWKWPAGKPKPKMAITHLPHFRVYHADLEAYLSAVYRMRDFDFFKATGVTPGIVPEYIVTGDLPPAWESKNKAEKIRYGQRVSDVTFILNVLCRDGFIPAGRYQIDTKPRPKAIDLYRALLRKHQDPTSMECSQFRTEHRNDSEFMKQAAVLDQAVTEWLVAATREKRE